MNSRERRPGRACISTLAVLVVIVLSAAGCRGLLRVSGRADERMVFHSPLPPIEERRLSLGEIAERLSARASQPESVRARAQVLVGGGGRRNPRQQFQALIFAKPPEFARVRATQSGATVFDILLNGQSIEVAVVPERTLFRGTLRDLRRYPQLLAGIDPAEITNAFFMESTLVHKLKRMREPLFYSSAESYEIRFTNEQGEEERYRLRKRDLLVDRYQRFIRNRRVAEIRFWGYEVVASRYLLPTEFAFEGATPTSALVTVQQLHVNESLTDALRAPVPREGFQIRTFADAAQEW